MTTAQLIFSIALGVVTLIITLFSVYVLSTTTWNSNRWVVKPSQKPSNPETP